MLGPSLRIGVKMRVPSPGLKRLVPNYYFAFSCRPVGAVLGSHVGGGGHSSCNASLSQPNIQWSDKQQSPCEGDGGGLKIWKKS